MNTYRKIEFWTATALFLFGLFTALSHTLFVGIPDLERMHGGRFRANGLVFDYYINYLLPHLAQLLTMYLAFITMGQLVMGRFIPQKRYDLAVLTAVGCFAAYFLVLLVSQTYERAELLVRYRTLRGAYMNFAKNAFVKTLFIAVIYAAYALLQLSYLELLSERVNKSARLRKILVELAVAAGIWIFLTTVTFNMGAQGIGIYLLFMSPAVIQSWFLLQYRLLPDYFSKKINRWIMFRNLAVVTVVVTVFCFLICLAATNTSGISFSC
ncbi:hypothetical protein MKQ70_04905 [Chitinophaga sedimenti]|uniref:hypothetical protein n=1 Tax=Chitinophaga sedimenti TaxID=2033606 RepID=UPI00200642FF|nr:hypothetical protein [Chitinophaga sedimenti]MCK7554379.1 hypothetical protein [Chitinophaga sedimenti]